MGLADACPHRRPRSARGCCARFLPGGGERRSTAFRAARFLEAAAVPRAERYGRLMQVLTLEQRAELWTDDARAEIGALVSTGLPARRARRPTASPACSASTSTTYLPGDLLPKSDIASMAHSLELRSPLLDHRVVELGLVAARPSEAARARGQDRAARARSPTICPPIVAARGKSGLRRAARRVVPRRAAAARARRCCSTSTARSRGWFRAGAVERLLDEHAAGRADNGHRLWTLVMLELWQRAHVDAPRAAAAA